MRASLRLDHQLLAVQSEHRVHCMLELTTPPAPSDAERPPLHLSLVIDRSGSMAGRKLDVTKRCAAFLVEHLRPQDHLSLVAFDDHVRLLLPLVPVGGNEAPIRRSIDQISAGGSTNLSGGWLKGVETLATPTGPNGSRPTIRKVLLLTDGMANQGITDPRQLTELARSTVEGQGIATTTIGFGAGFSEDLLTAMAQAGHGAAYFAETPDDAPGIFGTEFEDLVSLVAQNVSVEIRPGADVQVVGVLNEHPITHLPNRLQVSLGDAYGDERRRVVFELQIPSLASLGPAKVADVVVRYVEVGEQIAAHELTVPLMVNLVSADEAAAQAPDATVTEEITVLLAARAQDQARDLADAGEFEQARQTLLDAAARLRAKAATAADPEELLARAKQIEGSATSMSEEGYGISRKELMYGSLGMRLRRAKLREQQGEEDDR